MSKPTGSLPAEFGVKLPQVHKQHEQTSRRACGIETSALMTEQVTETTDTVQPENNSDLTPQARKIEFESCK